MSRRLAYIVGVLKGDGFLDKNSVGLNVKDKDFALEFRKNLEEEFGKNAKLHRYNDLWRVLLHSRRIVKFFKDLNYKEVALKNEECMRAFLKGMFDSEGSVNLFLAKGIRIRRVELYNTNMDLLEFCVSLLNTLKISCRKIDTKYRAERMIRGRVLPSGKCHRFSLTENRENFSRFEHVVGFSIKRKSDKLRDLISSYQEYRSKWKNLKELVLAAKASKSYGQLRAEFKQVPKGTIDRWLYSKKPLKKLRRENLMN